MTTETSTPDDSTIDYIEASTTDMAVWKAPVENDLEARRNMANQRKSQYVMLCGKDRWDTRSCQDHKLGYFCNAYGELKQQKTATHTNDLCESLCICHDILPVSRCDLLWSGVKVCNKKRDVDPEESGPLTDTSTGFRGEITSEEDALLLEAPVWTGQEVEQFSVKKSFHAPVPHPAAELIEDEASLAVRQGPVPATPGNKPGRRKSDFAMVCGDSKNATMACMDDKHKYYCDSFGVLKQQTTATHNNNWCLSKCNSIDMNPIAQCYVGWDMSTTCLKKRQELLQYFDDEAAFDAFAANYVSTNAAQREPLLLGRSIEDIPLQVNHNHFSDRSISLHSIKQTLRAVGHDTRNMIERLTSSKPYNKPTIDTTTYNHPITRSNIRSNTATMAKPSVFYLVLAFAIFALVNCNLSTSPTSTDHFPDFEQGRYVAFKDDAAFLDASGTNTSLSNATNEKYGCRGKCTYAMSCYESQQKTAVCQGEDYQYYCDGFGKLQRRGEFGNIFCDDHCWCIDLDPKPSCAWLGFGYGGSPFLCGARLLARVIDSCSRILDRGYASISDTVYEDNPNTTAVEVAQMAQKGSESHEEKQTSMKLGRRAEQSNLTNLAPAAARGCDDEKVSFPIKFYSEKDSAGIYDIYYSLMFPDGRFHYMHDPYPDQYCEQRYDAQCYHCDNIDPINTNRKMRVVALPIYEGWGHCTIRFTTEREGKGDMFGFTLFPNAFINMETPGFPAFAICYFHPKEDEGDPAEEGPTALEAIAAVNGGKKFSFFDEDMLYSDDLLANFTNVTKRQITSTPGCADSNWAPNEQLTTLTLYGDSNEYLMYVPSDGQKHIAHQGPPQNDTAGNSATDVMCLRLDSHPDYPLPVAECGHCKALVTSVSVDAGHCQLTIKQGQSFVDFSISASEGTKYLSNPTEIYNVTCTGGDTQAPSITAASPAHTTSHVLEARSITVTVTLTEYHSEINEYSAITWTDTYGDYTTTVMTQTATGTTGTWSGTFLADETIVYIPLAEPNPVKKREAEVMSAPAYVDHDAGNGLHENSADSMTQVVIVGLILSVMAVVVILL